MSGKEFPVWVAQLELGGRWHLEGVCAAPSGLYDAARVLIRLHGDPVGFLEFSGPADDLTAAAVVEVAWGEFGDVIRDHLAKDGIQLQASQVPERFGARGACQAEAEGTGLQPISVVLCTRNRAEMLAGCLAHLRGLSYERFEVLVIDNAPNNDSTRRRFEETVGDDSRFRYVCEPGPGLSRARNRGLAEASSPLVAFTDDDCIVDPRWLHGIARGFGREAAVGCVTGIAPAARLDTPAQRFFDRRVPWSAAATPRVFDLETRRGESPLYPFNAGSLGAGANFAVDRRLVIGLGGFDEALGAGAPTCGGEDLDMFVRILRSGRTLAFEPSALVWHIHRALASDLNDQMRGFGVGLGAYLATQLRDRTVRGFFLRQAPRATWHMARSLGQTRSSGSPSAAPLLAEIRGLAASPLAYRRARRALRETHSARP